MQALQRIIQGMLERGEALSPGDGLFVIACLTLITYLVLLVSGRGRLI